MKAIKVKVHGKEYASLREAVKRLAKRRDETLDRAYVRVQQRLLNRWRAEDALSRQKRKWVRKAS